MPNGYRALTRDSRLSDKTLLQTRDVQQGTPGGFGLRSRSAAAMMHRALDSLSRLRHRFNDF